MPLPETIFVKYTEEEAEFVSVRPVLRQQFRLVELVDMVLGVTGKDAARLRQILRSGTVVFHGFRYWWNGIESAAGELDAVLAVFPDDDPSRIFDTAACTQIFFDRAVNRTVLELSRKEAGARLWLRRRSLWDAWMGLAAASAPAYLHYSYLLHGDLYQSPVTDQLRSQLHQATQKLAPRRLREQWNLASPASAWRFLCPRPPRPAAPQQESP